MPTGAVDRPLAGVAEMDTTEIRARLEAALEAVGVPDPAAVAEDLDPARFVDDAGELRADAVEALAARYRTMSGATRRKTGRAAGLAEAERRFGPKPASKSAAGAPDTSLTGRAAGLAEAERRFGPSPHDAA